MAANATLSACLNAHAHSVREAVAGLDDGNFLFGAALAALGACLLQIGVALHRRFARLRAGSLLHSSSASSSSSSSSSSSASDLISTDVSLFRMWASAVALLAGGALLLVWSLALLPASVALPLAGVGLAAGAFANSKIFGSGGGGGGSSGHHGDGVGSVGEFSARDFAGAALVVCGALLAASVANKRECALTPAELRARLFAGLASRSGTYSIAVAAWIGALGVAHVGCAFAAAASAWRWAARLSAHASQPPSSSASLSSSLSHIEGGSSGALMNTGSRAATMQAPPSPSFSASFDSPASTPGFPSIASPEPFSLASPPPALALAIASPSRGLFGSPPLAAASSLSSTATAANAVTIAVQPRLHESPAAAAPPATAPKSKPAALLIRDAAAAAEAAAEFDEAAEEAAASAACWRRVRALVFAAFTLRFELAL
jgi:hypothetical protein